MVHERPTTYRGSAHRGHAVALDGFEYSGEGLPGLVDAGNHAVVAQPGGAVIHGGVAAEGGSVGAGRPPQAAFQDQGRHPGLGQPQRGHAPTEAGAHDHSPFTLGRRGNRGRGRGVVQIVHSFLLLLWRWPRRFPPASRPSLTIVLSSNQRRVYTVFS